jgi:hypothetical protein
VSVPLFAINLLIIRKQVTAKSDRIMAFPLSSPDKAKATNPYDFDLGSDDDDQIIFAGGSNSKTSTLSAVLLQPPLAGAYVKKRPGPVSIASSRSSSVTSDSSSIAGALAKEDEDENNEDEDSNASTRQDHFNSGNNMMEACSKDQQRRDYNEISRRFLTIDDLDAVLVLADEHIEEETEAVAGSAITGTSPSTPSSLSKVISSSLGLSSTTRTVEMSDQGTHFISPTVRNDKGTQCQFTGIDAAVQSGREELAAPLLARSTLWNSPSSTSNLKEASRREIWLAYLALLEEQQAQFVRTRQEMMALIRQAHRTTKK